MKKVLALLLAGTAIFVVYNYSPSPHTEDIHVESLNEEPSDMVIHEPGECFTLDDNFTFCIPVKSFTSQGALTEMQNKNESIRFINILMDDSITAPASACISTYRYVVAAPMDTVFNLALSQRHIDDTEEDYELISCGKYSVDGIPFYQKIAIRGGDFCTILHYFMENDFSDTVYEIKVGGSPSELDKLKALAEAIAVSAHFQNEDPPEEEAVGLGKLAMR